MKLNARYGTELGALYSTRRWLMVLGTVAWMLPLFFIVRYQWVYLSAVEHVFISIGLVLLVIAVIGSAHQVFLWLFPVGQSVILLCGYFAPDSSPNWMLLITLSSWLSYFLIALTPRAVGLFMIPVGSIVTASIWASAPSIVVPGALNIFGGWVVYAQVLAADASLWWAWNKLKDEARDNDERIDAIDCETERLLDLQTRARYWRASAAKLHESILNSLRYALGENAIDRARLRELIDFDGKEQLLQVELHDAHSSIDEPYELPETSITPTFDKARFLVSAPVAAMSIVGAVYFVEDAIQVGGKTALGCVLGIIGLIVSAILVFRRQRIGLLAGAIFIFAPALVPWLINQQDFVCSASSLVTPIMAISGYSLMVIIAWGRWSTGLIGLAIWGVGGYLVVVHFGASCRNSVSIALLNSLVILPVVLAVAALGARGYQRAVERSRVSRKIEVIERSRANAALTLNGQLNDAIIQGQQLLGRVVMGAEVQGSLRESLELVEGRIRSAIQVDPERNGAFAVFTRQLVEESALVGVRLHVRTLVSSQDHRPLPADLERTIHRLLEVPAAQPLSVQTFTDGVEDHISIEVTQGALEVVGLGLGGEQRFDDVVLQVELADEDLSNCLIIISRPIRDAVAL